MLENTLIHKGVSERNSVNIEYNIDKYLDDMIKLQDNELWTWIINYEILAHQIDGDGIAYVDGFENIHPLDVLYNVAVKEK